MNERINELMRRAEICDSGSGIYFDREELAKLLIENFVTTYWMFTGQSLNTLHSWLNNMESRCERIKEIADRCHEYVGLHYDTIVFDKEKFARLIIEECHAACCMLHPQNTLQNVAKLLVILRGRP